MRKPGPPRGLAVEAERSQSLPSGRIDVELEKEKHGITPVTA